MSDDAGSLGNIYPPSPSMSSRGYRAWLEDGYRLFRKAPWLWLGGTAILLVISMVLRTASKFGLAFLHVAMSEMFVEENRTRSILLLLLTRVLVEGVIVLGIMALCYGVASRLARHGTASWGDFFSLAVPGYTQRTEWRIAGLALWTGLLNALPLATLVAIASITDSIDRLLDAVPSFLSHPVVLIGGVVLLVLLAVRGILALLMAQAFALQLVLFGGCRPVQALRLSLRGCRGNIWDMVWFVLAILIFSVIVALPTLGLGVLLLWPIMVCSWYCAYQDIYRQNGYQT